MDEYDLIAEWYASTRDVTTGVPELTAFASTLPSGAWVLDVGCGTGIPLTRLLLQTGCHVFGVDSSTTMLDRFRANCPDTPSVCAPIQSCDLRGWTFDGAVAWGVIFHLTHADQHTAIAKVSQTLKPGALFLFTAGNEHGSVEGSMNGVVFRYFSYSVSGYRDLLREHGLTLIDTHSDRGDNIYYLARKDAAAGS